MNTCNFVGKLISKELTKDNDGVDVLFFDLEVQSEIKGKKRLDILTFELWSTSAIAFSKYSNIGDIIVIESTARRDKETEEVYFRVKNFKILVGED